ncbi:MAG: glycosyltransferase family 1 protein [Pseudomonadota bacterium]
MKIAVITDAWHPQVNGVVRALSYLEREVEALGHEVRFFTPQDRRSLPCPSYPEIRLSVLPGFRLRRELRAYSPDAIHIVTEGPLGIAARAFCKRRGVPFTTSFHTRFPEYVHMRYPLIPLSWGYAFVRWFHGAARRTLVTTDSLRRELQGHGFDRLGLWSRGVDTELFRPRDELTRSEHGPVFVYMGRVAVEKNIEQFLALDLPGPRWVIGDGPILQDLKQRYPEVRFFGTLQGEALSRQLAQADVFVFPSRTDTLGLVVMEALACGLPVAAFPVQGPRNLIESGVNGVLDEDLRAAALACLQLNPTAARASALRFSWRHSMQEFLGQLAPIQQPLST